MNTMMKWGVRLVVVVLLGLAGTALWVRSQIDPQNLRARAEQVAGDALGRTVTVGSVDLSWSGAVVLGDVQVSGAGGKGRQLAVKAIRASVHLASIASGLSAVESISFDEPVATLVRSADGTTDVDDILNRLSAGPASQGTSPSAGAGQAPQRPGSTGQAPTEGAAFTMPPVTITAGKLTVADAGSGNRWLVEGLGATMQPGGPGLLAVDADATVDGRAMHVAGNLSPAARTFAIGAAHTLVQGMAVDAAAGTLAFTPAGLSLSPTTVALAGHKGQLELATSSTGALTGRLALPGLDLATVRPGVTGSADLRVDLGGSLTEPRFSGEAALAQVTAALPGLDPAWGAKLLSGKISLKGDRVEGTNLSAEVMGLRFSPTLEVLSLLHDPVLNFDSGGVTADIGKLASLLPPAQRKELERFSPEGAVAVRVKAAGHLRKPELSGGVSIARLMVHVPGIPDPVKIEKGLLKLSGDRIELEPTRLVARATTLSVSGHAQDVFENPTVDLAIEGHRVALAPFADLLPPAVARTGPDLVADVDARISGPAKAPGVRAEVRPVSGSMTLGDQTRTHTLRVREGGSISVAAGLVKVDALPLAYDAVPFTLSAGAQLAADRLKLQTLSVAGKGVRLSGQGAIGLHPVTLDHVALEGEAGIPELSPSSTLVGRVHLQVSLDGPPDSAAIAGSATSDALELRLPNGGAIALTKLLASFEGTPRDLAIPSIRASIAGGSLSGEAHVHPGAPTSFSADVTGTRIATLLREVHSDEKLASGDASMHFEGKVLGSDLSGTGSLSIESLVVDASRTAGVRQARAALDKGAGTARTAAGLGMGLSGLDSAGMLGNLSGLLGQKGVAGLVGGGMETVQYYKELLDELSHPQTVGSVKSPIKAQGGLLAFAPISGQNLTGNVRIAMAGLGLSGTVSLLRLGKVEIRDVTLAGTLADPAPHADLSKVTLAGKPAPKAATTASSAMGGQLDLKQQLKKQAAKALKGNPLGALLGADDGSDAAASPPPDQPAQQQPAQQQSPQKKVVNQLFKSLFH